ncbi:zinc finger RNA-binding protein-like [Stegodyphus dumicola]|uniref:zinc finger RNA-binding protein-like n=1 Tax=Stegodyphus dumicola TaxID=202533 RepID=UPI0015ABE274|nr:zinc finger RNA-binding protein-like [Stegodyphus dumicola]XP_035220175.1 zinc finger RNA-binding protein-like [Stegodyphus dumicola]
MEQSFHCSLCNISYSDLKYLLEHCQTLEHANKIQEKANENKVNNISEQNPLGNNNGNSVLNDKFMEDNRKSSWLQNVPSQKYNTSGNVFYSSCDICQKQFSGPEPYQQHIVSAAHLRKVAVWNLTASSSSSNGIINTLICKTCDKNFSGPVPFEQHLNSETHRKKVQSENLLEKLKETSTTDCGSASKNAFDSGLSNNIIITEADTTLNVVYKHTDTGIYASKEYTAKTSVPTNWFCDVCQKGCTGPIPYQQHMSSEVHRKNLRKIEVSQKIIENLTQINETPSLDLSPGKINNLVGVSADPQALNSKEVLPANGAALQNWYCRTCQKNCSGPIPFEQHMSSDIHRKNIKKAEITARLYAQPIPENKQSETNGINLPSYQSGSISLQKPNSLLQEALPLEQALKSSENKVENST